MASATRAEGVLRPPGGPPESVFVQHMYEKYARKSLSNVIYTFLNSGFPDPQTERQDALEY